MPTCRVTVLPGCAICQDDERGVSNVVVTRCGHIFHESCLEEWHRHVRAERLGTIKCPYCNTCLESRHSTFSIPPEPAQTVRLHQLVERRVNILAEGEPSPEEELEKLRSQLEALKLALAEKSQEVLRQGHENTLLVENSQALEKTIEKLRAQSKSHQDQADGYAAQLKQDRELYQKGCASSLKDEERLRKILENLKEGGDRVKGQVAGASGVLERKMIEQSRLNGLLASQRGTIRILEAQAVEAIRQKDQLEQMMDLMVSESQMMADGRAGDAGRSHHLLNVIVALRGRFSKLESEYSKLKQVLDDKEAGRPPQSVERSAKKTPERASPPRVQACCERAAERGVNKGKGREMDGFIGKFWVFQLADHRLVENVDPRLLA